MGNEGKTLQVFLQQNILSRINQIFHRLKVHNIFINAEYISGQAKTALLIPINVAIRGNGFAELELKSFL